MRIIRAGGRDFNDYRLLESECIEIISQLAKEGYLPTHTNVTTESKSDIEIVCGKARGADTLGEQLSKKYNLPIKYFIPDWDGLGKRAGYVRNSDMAIYAKEDNGVLIAFHDGVSKGTKHMIDLANKNGLRVFVVKY